LNPTLEQTSFRSLQRRLLQPLLILSAIAAMLAGVGVYLFENKALQSDLQKRGQLLSTALVISAETSSSLADFHRMVLAIASEPSIESILLLDLNYQPIFRGDHFEIDNKNGELDKLENLIKQATATGLSIGATVAEKENIYRVISLINISALPQKNIFKPEPSLLLISLHTQQAVTEAFINASSLTALFLCIGLIAFTVVYFLVNTLVLKPSQRIVAVMESQSHQINERTDFQPVHELGLIGQTFDQLVEKLNAREQSLEQALIKAQDANKAKSQFLASMSHEIRTPMNGVIGMLYLLTEEPLDEKSKKYVRIAKSSADSLLALINDILDVSKIEAGKLDVEIIDFDIHSLFTDLASSMSYRIKSPELTLILDIDSIKNQIVQGDPNRIRQIVINLLGNAIKFTQYGEIVIHAVINTQGDNLQLSCDISDTGIGIASEKIDQLFDSFTQADSSTTREYGGTGLGLSIVKQLCQLMGGDVGVTSVAGQGSKFSFTIELKRSDETLQPTTNLNISDTELPNTALAENTNKRLLLVEDNSINQLVALRMLEKIGFVADVSENGQEAIDQLNKVGDEYYSLILMDCQMPVMDGFIATKKIRQGDAGDYYRDIPIIAMTANAMQGDREKCINAGMNNYITKPIDGKLLASYIEKMAL
jgi:signal transduction histidine kinase/ActR/RegA family two-component response regulator